MYFVTMKVQQVFRGKLPKKLRRNLRLLFHTPFSTHFRHQRQQRASGQCLPMPFHVRTGRKYLVFVKKVSPGRYAPVTRPELMSKKLRRQTKKLLCKSCCESRTFFYVCKKSAKMFCPTLSSVFSLLFCNFTSFLKCKT